MNFILYIVAGKVDGLPQQHFFLLDGAIIQFLKLFYIILIASIMHLCSFMIKASLGGKFVQLIEHRHGLAKLTTLFLKSFKTCTQNS